MEKTRRSKANLLRTLHSRTLKAVSLIMLESSIDKELSANLTRNYKSILSIIEKEANK